MGLITVQLPSTLSSYQESCHSLFAPSYLRHLFTPSNSFYLFYLHLPVHFSHPVSCHHHKGKNHLGMETIKIPSPSTILDSTEPAPGSTRGKPTKPAPRFTQKPKQTKSRNGTDSELSLMKASILGQAASCCRCADPITP